MGSDVCEEGGVLSEGDACAVEEPLASLLELEPEADEDGCA